MAFQRRGPGCWTCELPKKGIKPQLEDGYFVGAAAQPQSTTGGHSFIRLSQVSASEDHRRRFVW